MMKRVSSFIFAAMVVCSVAAYDASAQAAGDEAAIRQVAQVMQDGWDKKDGEIFASLVNRIREGWNREADQEAEEIG